MRILWPQERYVSDKQLIAWAQDDIANGASGVFAHSSEVVTLEDAIAVLNDSGTVTLAKE